MKAGLGAQPGPRTVLQAGTSSPSGGWLGYELLKTEQTGRTEGSRGRSASVKRDVFFKWVFTMDWAPAGRWGVFVPRTTPSRELSGKSCPSEPCAYRS